MKAKVAHTETSEWDDGEEGLDNIIYIDREIEELKNKLEKKKKKQSKERDKWIIERCFKINHYNSREYFIPVIRKGNWYWGTSIKLRSHDNGIPYITYDIEFNSYGTLIDGRTEVIGYRDLILQVNKHVSKYLDMNVKEIVKNKE